jgi:hypothetical protein
VSPKYPLSGATLEAPGSDVRAQSSNTLDGNIEHGRSTMKPKKKCAFCGEPLAPTDRECKQCGWDSTKAGKPPADPEDVRARIVVGLGLLVAYGAMSALINGAELPKMPLAARTEAAQADAFQPAPQEAAIAIGARAVRDSGVAIVTPSNKPITIKVADVKNATVLARDAIHYDFTVPETDQTCHLLGTLKSSGGDVEVLLLTDDQFIFWRANTAAIPHSNWEPQRGSDLSLGYDLSGPGNYYLIVSNALSNTTHRVVQVKAQVKCAVPSQTASAK